MLAMLLVIRNCPRAVRGISLPYFPIPRSPEQKNLKNHSEETRNSSKLADTICILLVVNGTCTNTL